MTIEAEFRYGLALGKFQDALMAYRKAVVDFEHANETAPVYMGTEQVYKHRHERRMAEHNAKMDVLRLYNDLLTKLQATGVEP